MWKWRQSEMNSNRTAARAVKYVAPMSRSRHFSATYPERFCWFQGNLISIRISIYLLWLTYNDNNFNSYWVWNLHKFVRMIGDFLIKLSFNYPRNYNRNCGHAYNTNKKSTNYIFHIHFPHPLACLVNFFQEWERIIFCIWIEIQLNKTLIWG